MAKEQSIEDIVADALTVSLVLIPLLQILANDSELGWLVNLLISILIGAILAALFWNDVTDLLTAKVKYIVSWLIGNGIACYVINDWWTFFITIITVVVIKVLQYYYNQRC